MLISDFARLGQVSVRMLRHYDATGLLEPADVDPWTGYRHYQPEQLHALNRLVALKELGFTLGQVRHILQQDPSVEELRGMLTLRRAQLEDEARAIGTRLMAVESRLRMIEREDTVSDYVVKTIPAVRLVARTATLRREELSQHIGPMFDAVQAGLRDLPGALATPIATYAESEQGLDVVVGYATGADAPAGCQVVEYPEAQAVCGVHLGPMATIGESWQEMHRWIAANGHAFAGPCRELYIRAESADQADWVTELQQPVE